jgi:hypothetical protein
MVVSARPVPLEIAFEAPQVVRDTLATLGRTEDVRFAPGGRRLALACYTGERIALADVEIDMSASGPRVAVTRLEQLESSALREPHGIDFADDDTLVVGKRAGGIAVFRLPPAGSAGRLTPVGSADSGLHGLLDSPGSVAVRSLNAGRHEVLACNNWTSTITRHTLDSGGALTGGEVVGRKWLDLPDGLAVSGDGRWLAVSNHNSHSVLVFAYPTLSEDSDPVGVLRGTLYPHGLRFGAGDRHLLVADAGAPFVHVFAPPGGGWQGAAYPAASIEVMDEVTFQRGHRNLEEGGPKGIDLDPNTNVLVVTSECQPLAFFDVGAALDRGGLDGATEALVRYELQVLAETERTKEAAAEARAQLAELVRTKAWRLTKPARHAYGAALRLKASRSRRRASAEP